MKALVAQGSSISVRDKHSRTPLHLSAWAGHLECCKLLIEHGADKSCAAMDDTTALHFAAQKGHLEVVRFLLNEGISLPCSSCNLPPQLHCKAGLSVGASVNGKTRKGMTPLMFGAQSGKPCNCFRHCSISHIKGAWLFKHTHICKPSGTTMGVGCLCCSNRAA